MAGLHEGVVASVFACAEPVAAAAGLILVDVEFGPENGRRVLRIVVDRPGGIRVADLETLHRRLGPLIDEVDPIAGSYQLEISSPGLERALKKDRDFEIFRGREIEVRTRGLVSGRREFTGVLGDIVEGEILLAGPGGEAWRIPGEQVARARLHVRL